jgi:hypothetical protein
MAKRLKGKAKAQAEIRGKVKSLPAIAAKVVQK